MAEMREEVDGTRSSKETIPLRDIPSSSDLNGGDLRDTDLDKITITLGSFETTSLQHKSFPHSFLEGNYRIVHKQKGKVTDSSIGVLLKAVHLVTGHILTVTQQPRLLDSTPYQTIIGNSQDQSYINAIQTAVPLIKTVSQEDIKTDFFVGRWTVTKGSLKSYSYIECNIDGRACFQLPTLQGAFYNYQMWNPVTMVMYYRRLTNESDLSLSIFTVDGNSCNAQLVDPDPPQQGQKRVVFNYTPTSSGNLILDHIFSFKMEDNTSHVGTDSSDVGHFMYATTRDQVRWYLTYDPTHNQDGIVSIMATTCKQEAKRFYFVEPPFW